jgi:3-isopropylmalate dehydrogenase
MEFNIAVLPGDGIGPEIVREALKVLDVVAEKYGHTFNFTEVLGGGVAIDAKGTPLPDETLETCKASDAVLMGSIGGPKWDNLNGSKRPEAGLLGLRKGLGLYNNLRPAMLFEELADACPLKPSVIGDGLDLMVVRELTGGIYFGDKMRAESGEYACDVMKYSNYEVERIARDAFEIAMKRNKKVTNVDKANVLGVSRFWREIVEEVAKDYPEVELNHLYVDNAAMQLVINPQQFDVIVTSNLFGDILSDEASMLTGSIGMLPSASLATGSFGLYEPVHGSAPDISGQDKANPTATILSVAMMLRYSLNLEKEAEAIEQAVKDTLKSGYRTGDIFKNEEGTTLVGCTEMGEKIKEAVK